VATVGAASLSLIPVAEAVPETIVKVSLVLQSYQQLYLRYSSRSSTRRYVTVCEVVV
jgi:hypothetical protein